MPAQRQRRFQAGQGSLEVITQVGNHGMPQRQVPVAVAVGADDNFIDLWADTGEHRLRQGAIAPGQAPLVDATGPAPATAAQENG